VWCRSGEKEYAGIEFGFVNVISRRFLVVLFGVFFFEFGDDEWTRRGDELLPLEEGWKEEGTFRSSSVNVGIRSGWRYIRTSRVVFLDIRR